LFLSAVIFSLMSFAQTLPQFVILMALRGAFAPLYSVAADAMVADLIADKKRSEAYSLLRIINNVGIALGPAIGGFITTGSYTAAFILGSSSLAIFGLLVIFTIRETAPALVNTSHIEDSETSGYRVLFKDNLFISFCGSITLARIMPALVFVLLSVYVKENFAIPESQFGFLMTTNAIIVVLFQFSVTRLVSKLPPLRVLAFGSLIYAVGIGSIALGENFWAFMASMVVLTFGELLIAPTGTTLASQLAPAAQRGRYMSVYSLTVGIARGIGPVFGGMLNDNLSPAAIWYGGSAAGILAFIWFLGLFFQRRNRDAAENILTQTSSGDAS
jgi:MFS family permease